MTIKNSYRKGLSADDAHEEKKKEDMDLFLNACRSFFFPLLSIVIASVALVLSYNSQKRTEQNLESIRKVESSLNQLMEELEYAERFKGKGGE